METRVTTHITIKATPQEVFEYLSDPKCHYLWNPQLRNIKPLAKLKKGSRYTTETIILGVKMLHKNHVTKFIKNRELEIVNNKGPLHSRVNLRLESLPGKTRVVCETDVVAESNYFAFAVPALKLIARRELQSDMQALKQAAESNSKQ